MNPNDLNPPSKPNLPVAKKLPPISAPKVRVPKPPAPRPPVEEEETDPGYEVVEAPRPEKRGLKKSTRDIDSNDTKPDNPRAKKKNKRQEDYDDDMATRHLDEDDDGNPKPRKKKKKKPGIRISDEEIRDQENLKREWIVGIALVGFGLFLTIVGALKAGGMANAVLAVILTLVGTAVAIPVTIGLLMVIGMMLGIEYGTIGSAVRNLAAIMCLVQGIQWVLAAMGIPFYAYGMLTSIITLGLFMTLFELDVWEANMTTFFLNFFQTVMTVLLIGALITVASRGAGGGGGGGGFDEDGDPIPVNKGNFGKKPGDNQKRAWDDPGFDED
ncbi:MAG: hypothetical protein ACRCZF_03565 [Gemmataceae bacterium]